MRSESQARRTIRAVVAHHQLLVCQAISAVLQREGISVPGEAIDGRGAVELIFSLHPDIAVLSENLPLLNGMDVARRVLEEDSGTRTLILAAPSQTKSISALLNAGVAAYLPATITASQMLIAVDVVRRGAVYMHAGACGSAGGLASTAPQCPPDPLTLREREVLQLICEGKFSKEIGAIIGISPKTAESHRQRITHKLGVYQTAELVRYAVRSGIIQAMVLLPVIFWGRFIEVVALCRFGCS